MNLFYPGAYQAPGPAGKVYPEGNTVEGVVLHSMQGSYEGALTVLMDESVTNTNRYRAACWHFSILRDGSVFQHYPLDAAPFHAGNGTDNKRLIGVEHEGGPPGNLSEPLTEAQVTSGVALVLWIKEQAGWPDLARHVRLLEHGEVYSTSCPNGRIPWSRYALPQPLPGGEFLPEPDLHDVAKFWAAVAGGNVSPNVEITPVPAKRAGWERYEVEVQQ